MTDKGLLCTGAAGSAIAAICCFTPVLVIAFGLIGLSAWVGWLDYVLFPMLAFFLGLTGYALYRIRRGRLARAIGQAKATERS
jgi:mercuric ion transport protein